MAGSRASSLYPGTTHLSNNGVHEHRLETAVANLLYPLTVKILKKQRPKHDNYVFRLISRYFHAAQNYIHREKEQESQCAHNLILRRVRVTIDRVENQCVLNTISAFCSLSYPTRNAHMLYYILCNLSGSTAFSHIIS